MSILLERPFEFPPSSPSPILSGRSSADIRPDGFSDDEAISDGSPVMSPIPESKHLLSLYTNVELGVVSSQDKRDECLTTLAEIKKAIAEAELNLAHCRRREMEVLGQLQSIQEGIAKRRVTQADINIERVKYYRKRIFHRPRVAGNPKDIVTEVSIPSVPLPLDVGVV